MPSSKLTFQTSLQQSNAKGTDSAQPIASDFSIVTQTHFGSIFLPHWLMFPLTPPSHDPTNQCASHGPTNSMIFYCKLLLPQPDPSIYGRCAFYDTQSTANPCSTSQPSGMRSIPTNNTINPPHAAVGFYPDGWLTSGQSGPHSPNRLGVVVR